MRPVVIHRSTVLGSTRTASASLSRLSQRSSRSARSRSFRMSPGPQDVKGRLHLSGDVPARPPAVLARSNRVLTLRRILRGTTAKSPLEGIVSVHPSLTAAPGPRVPLAAAGVWSPGTRLASGVLAPATALPLALTYICDPDNAPRLPSGRTAPGGDRSGLWLRNAAAGLCVLAAAAAAVSCTAQYRMVDATRHLPAIAVLEALIPYAAALVFACLGIA